MTVILEGSIELRKDFLEFVRTRYPLGEEMVRLGVCAWQAGWGDWWLCWVYGVDNRLLLRIFFF